MIFSKRKARHMLLAILVVVSLAARGIAADVRWLGAADDVAQVTTSTVSGTWATGDTAVAEINNKQVVLTLGTDVATTDVAAELAAAINATSATSGLVGATLDETRNVGGQEIGEFNDVVASASGSVLTLTSADPGTPFTVSFSETTAGTGAMGAATTTTAATGKNWFDNADNWSATVTAGDNLIFDAGNVSCIYGLDNTIENLSIDRRNSYFGAIGLNAINNTHSGLPYTEYRQRLLDLPITAGTGTQAHKIGEIGSPIIASGQTYLDLGTNIGLSQTMTVNDSPGADATNGAAVQIAGGKSLGLTVNKGTVSIGLDPTQNATNLATLNLSSVSNITTDANVRIGSSTKFSGAGPHVTQLGGVLYLDFSLEFGSSIPDLNVSAGVMNLLGGPSGTIQVFGGSVNCFSGDATTLSVFGGGTFDATSAEASTYTNVNLFNGFTYKDPNKRITLTNGLDFEGCSPSDGTLEVQGNQTWTPSGL